MHRLIKYNGKDKISDLVTAHYRTLPVISRFGISLGFGDKTIEKVCGENNVDTNTFLAIIHLLLDEDHKVDFTSETVSVESLLSYLHNSHEYFLDYRLPEIRTKLAEVLHSDQKELDRAVIRYFDEYVAEVRKHMEYEEKTVFPYVRSLLRADRSAGYSINIFTKQHDQVEARLTEFKQIIIKYYPARSTNDINSVLFDIFNCEYDMASHNAIEDMLFVPAVMHLEHNYRGKE